MVASLSSDEDLFFMVNFRARVLTLGPSIIPCFLPPCTCERLVCILRVACYSFYALFGSLLFPHLMLRPKTHILFHSLLTWQAVFLVSVLRFLLLSLGSVSLGSSIRFKHTLALHISVSDGGNTT